MTPRIDAEFVEWPSAPDDRTLGVVDFSIFPHLGHEHISRMYRKLGLRSRTELSRLDPARLDADHGRWLDAPPDSVRTIA